jgi:hypothetical protein
VAAEHVFIQLEPGERHTTLHTPMELEQLDVHIHGIRQLGMRVAD